MYYNDEKPQGLPLYDGHPPGGVPRHPSYTILLVLLIIGIPALVGVSAFAFN